MGRTRYRAKVDGNQSKIVRELLMTGCAVFDTSTIGKGFPDLVVSRNGVNLLVEIKLPGKEKRLTEQESEFFQMWKGPVVVASCVEDVLETLEDLCGKFN